MESPTDKDSAVLISKDENKLPMATGISSEIKKMNDMKITVAAAQGGRKYMEDRVHIEIVRDPTGKLEHVFAAVYDGHGGTQASDFVRVHLHENITSNKLFYSENDGDVLSAIRQGFIRTHQVMQKAVEHWPMTASGYPCTAGTTASCAFFRNNKLYTGHVGDSAIILGNNTIAADGVIKLTEDHKPDEKGERQRIESVGGTVGCKAGVSRVVWKRPIRGHKGPIRRSTPTESIPFLAVARALGDFWSLNEDNNEYVVSPEPDVAVVQLEKTDQFIVLASDGLTNVLSPQKVINLLRDLNKDGTQNCTRFRTKDVNLEPNHAQFILNAAFARWGSLRADNISVICIKLNSEALPYGHPSVVSEDLCMETDRVYTSTPSAMVRVTCDTTQHLMTNPVRVIYNGSLERSMHQIQRLHVDKVNGGLKKDDRLYTGPGFIVPDLPADLLADDDGSDEETCHEDDFSDSIVSDCFVDDSSNAGALLEKIEMNKSRLNVDYSQKDFSGSNPGVMGDIGVPTSCFVDALFKPVSSSSYLSPVVMLESMRSSAAVLRSSGILPGCSRSAPNTQPVGRSPKMLLDRVTTVNSSSQPAFLSPSCPRSSTFLKDPSDVYKFRGNTSPGSQHNAGAFGTFKHLYSKDTIDAEAGGVSSSMKRPWYRANGLSTAEVGSVESQNTEEPAPKRSRIWNFMSGMFSKYL